MVAPQLDMFATAPEWIELTLAKPNLVTWLERMNARPSMQTTTWQRVAAMVA
jgi:glutathione S-transferase